MVGTTSVKLVDCHEKQHTNDVGGRGPRKGRSATYVARRAYGNDDVGVLPIRRGREGREQVTRVEVERANLISKNPKRRRMRSSRAAPGISDNES